MINGGSFFELQVESFRGKIRSKQQANNIAFLNPLAYSTCI